MNAPSDFLQAERILRIETPLGDDTLLAEKFSLREEISGLFEGRVTIRSKTADLKPDALLGKLVDVSLEVAEGQRRGWNALVTGLIAGPKASRALQSYQLVLRPELWLLSQKSDCRIWLDKTAIEVAETLLGEHGIAAPQTKGVTSPPPAQHYSVQFNETDLAYLTRRLEEDGLFYWIEHEPGAHVMHIADHASGYTDGPDPDLRYSAGSTDRNHINRFETQFRYTPGVHASRDWNFETPGLVPGGDAPSLVSLPRNGSYELFEYPALAGYGSGSRASEGIDNAALARVSKLRMQAVEAAHCRVEGASHVRTLAAGRRFKPYDVANPDNVFGEYVTLAIEHEAVDTSYESIANQPEYVNRFIAVPADVPATPDRTTPHPRIDGTQVAIIAGPEGEEIHPDEYGRIKVWFPWDRRAKKDGSDTCWIRVMQNWAGAGFGGQVIPRIGMEVMVAYLDGDPDRPVVTGVVPNARQKVPYSLPANKTKTVFRTQSHKSEGFNELSFEDEQGREEVFMHAQRDQRVHVENSRSKRVDNNQAESIGHNKTIEVGNNHQEVIGGNMTLMVGPNILQRGVTAAMGVLRNKMGDLLTDKLGGFTDKLGFLGATTMGEGNMVIGVGKNKAETVMVSSTEVVGGAKTTTVGGGYQLAVGGIRHDSVLMGAYEEVGQNKTVVVGKTFELVCGKTSIKMEESGRMTIKAKHIIMKADQIDEN
jgi:type VI secretion system secreted protein VgrG